MQNVLVTGGAGFIGSNFVHYLLKTRPEVRIVNLDALTYAGSRENLKELPDPSRHTFVHGDICDRELVGELLHAHRVDTLVHFAAETHVDRSILNPEPFLRTNIQGTYTLLEAARQYWLVEKALPREEVRFHHVSTDEVFGTLQPGDPPFSESTNYAPRNPYSASKAASDHLVRAYFHTYGLPVTISNCSNNYGPYQFPEKMIPLMVLNAVEGKPLPIYGDGKNVRDWLYVDDHCSAVWAILAGGRVGETYNIGGECEKQNREIVDGICEVMEGVRPSKDNPALHGKPYRDLITFVKDRPGHDRRYAINCDKIKQELGWAQKYTFENGLRNTIHWYLHKTAWVRN